MSSTPTQSSAAVVEEEEAKALQLKTDRVFASYFHSLPPQPDTVRLFDRKTFYSAHGSDAHFLAETYFKSAHAIRIWDRIAGSMPLEYVAVRSGIEFRAVLHMCLVEQRRKVEIYSVSPKSGRWELAKHASPGNFDQIDDDMFLDDVAKSAEDTAVATAVSIAGTQGNRVVGIAYVDFGAMELGVLEFPDDDQFSNLECALLQVGAKECYIPEAQQSPTGEKDASGKPRLERSSRKLREILDKCKIPVTDCKRSDYSRKDIEQDVGTLCGTVIHNFSELELVHAMEALACLIKNLGLLQMIGINALPSGTTTSAGGNQMKFFRLKKVDLTQFMKLDYVALRSLNLVPAPGEGRSSMNLFNLLNKCLTPMGSRRLLRWMKQPLVDVVEINKRLDMVEEFVECGTTRTSLCECLKSFSDMDRMCKKLTLGKATLQDVVGLHGDCSSLETFVKQLQDVADNCVDTAHAGLLRSVCVEPLSHLSEKLKKFVTLVEHLVDLDKAANERVYEINVSWSDKLGEVDAKRKQTFEKMERLSMQAARDIGVKSVKLTDTSQWGWVLRITKSDEKKLRDYGKRYTALDKKGAGSSAGGAGIRFTCRDLEELNVDYRALSEEYESISHDIIVKVLEVARSYVPVFETVSDTIADVDALLSMASVSAARNYVRPTMHPLGAGRIILRSSRHPCVEAAALSGDALESAGVAGGDFIPNDATLEKDSSRFVIVTGPNMGGKSTYIRQIGVNVVMAQMGCFVPCATAEITAVDCILCRIGAGDSQIRGVSTFMAEMLETATILTTATPRSLVIIDELGRGTSTQDGFGLAWAISEHICEKIGCFALFATHFHELTELETRIPYVRNLHVTADAVGGRLILQYKIQEGPCDRSFGIHVAELADFPQDVIAIARRKASELEDFTTAKKARRDDESEMADGNNQKSLIGQQQQQLKELETFIQQIAAVPLDEINSSDDKKTIAAVKPVVDKFLASADPDTLALLEQQQSIMS